MSDIFLLFTKLVGLLNEEELLRIRRRCQMGGHALLAAVLTVELERREALEQHGQA